jgi:hypothetical protein
MRVSRGLIMRFTAANLRVFFAFPCNSDNQYVQRLVSFIYTGGVLARGAARILPSCRVCCVF